MDNVTDPGVSGVDDLLRGRQAEDRPPVRFPVWVKMAAALVVPLVAVAFLAGLQVVQARDNVRQVDAETSLAAVVLAPGGLFDALIIERGDAAVTVVGARDGTGIHTEDFAQSVRESDAAMEELRGAVRDGGPLVSEAYQSALDSYESLTELRSITDDHTEDANFGNMGLAHELYLGYSEVLDELSAAADALGGEITDPRLREAALALDAVNVMHDSISDITYNVTIAVSVNGLDDMEARDDVVRLAEEYRMALSDLGSLPGDPWAEEVAAVAVFEPYQMIHTMTQDALAGEPLDIAAFLELSPSVDRDDPPIGSSQAVANAADRGLTDRIEQLRSDAAAEQQRYLILALVVVVGATLVAIVVARSITKPMMGLARQAYEMANRGLPAAVQEVLETPPGAEVTIPEVVPVEVSSRDETQVVAAALNEVQLSAVDLAVQQATLRQQTSESLVDLGRRTQNLIGLQLELITDLENDETDPTALSHLYRLDHLATRARRNAESLVVLAGTEPRPTGGEPTSLFDVVRAALSEVEDYQRVQVARMDEAHVTGGAAVDLAHLLAEIVENGVLFSPPTQPVEVTGGLDEDGGYTITVEDHGIGMTEAQLDEANRRLAETRTFTAAPSRQLGHHVAGRLARRVGVRVWVAPGSAGGTVAKIHIPGERLVERPAVQPNAEAKSTPNRPPATLGASGPTRPAPPAFEDLDLGEYRVDGRPPAVTSEPAVTDAGLTRRVRGAHGPGVHTDIKPIRRTDALRGTEKSGGSPKAVTGRRADEVASMLTAFTGAVERGREDAESARSEREGDPTDDHDLVDEENR